MKLLSQMLYVCMDACNKQFASASNSQGHLTNRKKSFTGKAFIYYSTYILYKSSGESCGKSRGFKLTRKEKLINELKETQLNKYFYE